MSAEGTLIIDAQVFQSEAWDRGMGKYSLHFLEALLNQPGFPYKKAVVIFNKNLKLQPTAEETLRQKLSNVEFVWLDLKLPKMVPREKLEPLLDANTKILDKFIAEQGKIKPSFIILAPFIDSLCSVFPTNVEKIALVYDLIPLLYSERYSKSHMYQNYLQRFQLLLGADKLLTISQTVADDVAVYTGIDPAKITNIDGAPIHREGLTPQKPDIELPANYFIMPSGDELRKNNFRAVEAFEEYRKASGNMDSRLVLTSHFQPKTQKALNSLSSALIFSGNVSEAELLWLYQNAVATVFVSEYEGLGLPVLEAVETGKPVVCSNLTVFNEMSSSAFYYADEQNVASITETLQRAAASQDFAAKRKEYPAILKRYTW
ncbi:MAG TPA: glycosyltransferase family 1 protein, partial [Candidatus Saccharimonadales bacterium]|nr:glycosyltransferase family 1 protein [Candidatus Saccharimonadales bacterium]